MTIERWRWNSHEKSGVAARMTLLMPWWLRALYDVLAKIDAGQQLTGESGLPGFVDEGALERGLNAELTRAPGLQKLGTVMRPSFANSRNGYNIKTVATEVGDGCCRCRVTNGSFTPMPAWPAPPGRSGCDDRLALRRRRTIRDIQHHLASTIGTDLARDDQRITEEVADEVIKWQQRDLDALYPVIYLDAIVIKVRDGGHVRINKAAHIAVGVDMDGSNTFWGFGSSRPKAPNSGRRCALNCVTGAWPMC